MTASLNYDKITGELLIRKRLPGDTYQVNGKQRSVKDLFSMRHLPREMREYFPLVCDEEGIVWVPGELAADRVLPEPDQSDQKKLHIILCGGNVATYLKQRSL